MTTEGFELDFLARPIDGLSLGGGIAYTDAQVDKFFTPPGSTPTVARWHASCRSRRSGRRP